jgi:hypothetical protein
MLMSSDAPFAAENEEGWRPGDVQETPRAVEAERNQFVFFP